MQYCLKSKCNQNPKWECFGLGTLGFVQPRQNTYPEQIDGCFVKSLLLPFLVRLRPALPQQLILSLFAISLILILFSGYVQ